MIKPKIRVDIILFTAVTAAALIFSLNRAEAEENGSETVYEWPMIAHDTGWTAYSPDPRVKPPFRLKWATQGMPTHGLVIAEGKVFCRGWCLDAETGDVLWKSRGLGGNNTTPSYFKGRLYSGRGKISAYDASNGKHLWSKSGYVASRLNPRSGVAVCDGALYLGSIREHEGKKNYFLDALSAEDGKVIWSLPLIEVEETKRRGYHLGMSMGVPVVGGEKVFTTTHSPRMAFAVDRKTGKELWRKKDFGVWLAVGTDGKTVYVPQRRKGVWALDAKTGDKLWEWGGIEGDIIKANYATTGTAKYPPVIAYGKVFLQNYGRRYTALDATTGKELWVAGDRGGFSAWAGTCGPPSAAGGHIYTNGTTGKDFNAKYWHYAVAAVDHTTGKAVWKNPTSGKACARVSIAYGCMYVPSLREVSCYEPVPEDYTYEPQPPPDKPAAPPGPLAQPFGGEPGTPEAGGKPEGGNDWPMYGGCPARCGLKMKIGLPIKEAWKFQTGGKVKSSPVMAGGIVYAGSDSGKLYALELETGKEKWSAEVTVEEKNPLKVKWIRSAPAVADGIVVCGADDGVMRAFDAKIGKPKWQFRTAAQIRSSPAIIGDRVVFGSWDGHCYCVRLSDGKEFWRCRVGGPGTRAYAPFAVAQGRIYLTAWEEYAFQCLDLETGKPIDGYKRIAPGRGTKHPRIGQVQGIAVYRGLAVTAKGDNYRTGDFINATTGKIVGSVRGRGSAQPSLPAFRKDRVFYPASPEGAGMSEILSESGKKGKSKKKRRKAGFKHSVLSAPLVCGNLLIVATEKGTVEVHRIPEDEDENKKKVNPVWEWKSSSGAEIHTAPAAADGFIVIGSDDGHIYGFTYGREN